MTKRGRDLTNLERYFFNEKGFLRIRKNNLYRPKNKIEIYLIKKRMKRIKYL